MLALSAGCSRHLAASRGDTQTLPMPKSIDGTAVKQLGICRISVMNLREDPAYEAEMGTQMLMGAICQVIEQRDGWAMVSTPEGYIAWVTEPSLFLCDQAGALAWKSCKRIVVTAHYTPILASPKADADIVCDAVRGCIVACTGTRGKYWRCRLPDGTEGYLLRRDGSDCREYFSSQNPSGEDIVADAKLYMGIPYLWGGSSAKGLDCSGLSQRVYMDCGILLPRNASQQARSGDEVDISQGWERLQPGDLLFFGRPRDDGNTGIYHVAIYAGDGDIIHSSKGRVHRASILPERGNYYPQAANIVSARRILGSVDCGKAAWSIIGNGWDF